MRFPSPELMSEIQIECEEDEAKEDVFHSDDWWESVGGSVVSGGDGTAASSLRGTKLFRKRLWL